MDEVVQTARRARASIGEGLHDQVGAAGDLVDQPECGGLGEDLLRGAGGGGAPPPAAASPCGRGTRRPGSSGCPAERRCVR
jgi:hypothetical protein